MYMGCTCRLVALCLDGVVCGHAEFEDTDGGGHHAECGEYLGQFVVGVWLEHED